MGNHAIFQNIKFLGGFGGPTVHVREGYIHNQIYQRSPNIHFSLLRVHIPDLAPLGDILNEEPCHFPKLLSFGFFFEDSTVHIIDGYGYRQEKVCGIKTPTVLTISQVGQSIQNTLILVK